MRIGWVGGLDRGIERLEKAAEQAGHTLEWHSGRTSGRGVEGLETMIERSDVVVIVIEVNSHGGAILAKKLAYSHGRKAVMLRKPSISGFTRVLRELDSQVAA